MPKCFGIVAENRNQAIFSVQGLFEASNHAFLMHTLSVLAVQRC